MNVLPWSGFQSLRRLLHSSSPDHAQALRRIRLMECDIALPIKGVAILMLAYFIFLPGWGNVTGTRFDQILSSLQSLFWIYIVVNVAEAIVLLQISRLQFRFVRWAVRTGCLLDGLFLGALTLITGGHDSILYWLFMALIIRNAVSVSEAIPQLLLNGTATLCYVFAGVTDISFKQENLWDLDPGSRRVLELNPDENLGEPFVLRLILLCLMTVCCYAVQMLWERQRRATEEAREFAVRQHRLQSAGRLAAEIAHQIKNPLGIINNAAFSLQRALKSGKRDVEQQIQIIQEEVQRSDKILTQLMGYARLNEGRVEKLSILEELERAIAQVFPPGTNYGIKIHRDFGANFPPLFMQRTHLDEVLVNVIQNAREALQAKGNIFISAENRGGHSIRVVVADDGPGIPADHLERIFEAYYTKKERGTGLGLSIVRHNVELYDGTIRVESELGKGARFIISFPARTLTELAKEH